jgi:acyl-CoA synthetase (AMP-forming)/AMP-acid ligase II
MPPRRTEIPTGGVHHKVDAPELASMPGDRPPQLERLSELLDNAVRNWPRDPAVGISDKSVVLSYAELQANVQALAGQLRDLGIRHADTVAFVSDDCIEFLVALLAVVAADAVAAPVNPSLTAVEVTSILTSVKAKAVIVPEHMYGDFVASRTDSQQPPVWQVVLESRKGGHPQTRISQGAAVAEGTASASSKTHDRRPEPADIALMMLTGGTTAKPKVVPLTQANLAASINDICATYQLDHSDATLLVMPLYHGHGLIAGLLASLASGCAAYLPRNGKFSASTFWTDMVNIGATWYTAVPTIHQILLMRASNEYPKDHPPPLRFIRSCSAPLAPVTLNAIESAFGAPMIEAYGMTETTHQAASNPLPAVGPHKPSSVGLGTGAEIRIFGPAGDSLKPGELGEVCIKGPTVTPGYVDNRAANEASFVDGWFHSGDMGFLDTDQYLFLKGRIKELINRGGEKISPQNVDTVLLSNPKVEDAMSFGVPDPKYGEEINAAVVVKPGSTLTSQELEAYCLASLSDFEVPKKFYFLPELPRTAKDTDDRRQLSEMFGHAAP